MVLKVTTNKIIARFRNMKIKEIRVRLKFVAKIKTAEKSWEKMSNIFMIENIQLLIFKCCFNALRQFSHFVQIENSYHS